MFAQVKYCGTLIAQVTLTQVKYYGTLIATLSVLILSVDHIGKVLLMTELNKDSHIPYLAGAGLQLFEIFVALGIADLLGRPKYHKGVFWLLIGILFMFFFINLRYNYLYCAIVMTGNETSITLEELNGLDKLQVSQIRLAAIPIPLMGLTGVIVQAIFKRELDKEKKSSKKTGKSDQVETEAFPDKVQNLLDKGRKNATKDSN